jgi:hypothetical protein
MKSKSPVDPMKAAVLALTEAATEVESAKRRYDSVAGDDEAMDAAWSEYRRAHGELRTAVARLSAMVDSQDSQVRWLAANRDALKSSNALVDVVSSSERKQLSLRDLGGSLKPGPGVKLPVPIEKLGFPTGDES